MKSEITMNSQAARDCSLLYRVGGVAALLVVLTALVEIGLTFLPGGYATTETVTDWFTLLQNDWFMGLRNLGLLNILMIAFGVPALFATYIAHRPMDHTFAALAVIISFIGVAVFYATNRAFPMLDLSIRYSVANTETEKAVLAAAGQALLSVGQSHTPGTFLGFLLSEVGGILLSLVMLRGRVFSRAAAYAGLIGFGLFFVFEILSSFVPSLHDVALIVAMGGGIANMTWYILIARRLFQLSHVH
jgi:hypothetical protein